MTNLNGPVSLRAALSLCQRAGIGPLWFMLVLATLQAVLPLAGLLAMMHLVDSVADGIAGRLPEQQAWDQALFATVVAASVAFAGGLLKSLSSVVNEVHGRRLGDAGVQQLQEHAATLDLAEFDQPGFHDAMQRAGAEAGQRPVRLIQDLISVWVAVVSLLTMTALLAQVELWLPVMVGLAAVPIAWARRRHAKLRFTWHREHVVEQREVGYLGATLTGRATAKDVRVLGLRAPFGQRLAAARKGLRESLKKLARWRARDELLVHTLASGALFGAYVLLATDALAGIMTLGGLVLHAQAAQRTQNAVRDLLASATSVQEHRLFLRPLCDFLARAPTHLVSAKPAPSPNASSEPVTFAAEDLHFRYPEMNRDVLVDVNFRIAAGERVAIIGPNGSGKSTLIKLLCGLYNPISGQLRIADQDATTCSPEYLRQRISVLLQDANAFELTLRGNLQLGLQTPPDDSAIWQVLDLVGLGDRVRDLPLGLNSPWSRRLEGGVDWSVGEARRIVLARTLLRTTDALLLDEPFASLDGKTAAHLATYIASRPRTCTTVIVDHRGPALQCVDRVIWLDQGKVRAAGTPAEIAKQAGFNDYFPDWRA